jgi:hypothetical protein
MPRRDYDTTIDRAAIALVVGALVGSLLVGATMIVLGLAGVGSGQLIDPVRLGLIAPIYAFFYFAAGLAAVGVPIWIVLHRRGYRGRLAATVTGFFAAGLTWLLLQTWNNIVRGTIPEVGELWPVLISALPVAIIGAVVGFVVWRIAYRPVAVTP